MTATDELCRMLDERGVEWRERVWGGKHSVVTFWRARGVRWHYRENRFGGLRLHADGLAPEQAIEATLGRGTCYDVALEGEWFECSACGCVRRLLHPHYCPSCGAEVVE